MNILYQFDDNYAPYAAVSMYSLLSKNKASNIKIFLAGMNVSEESKIKIEKLFLRYSCKYEWVDTQNVVSRINELKLNGWNGSLATWLKIFILNDLNTTEDRCLYIDSDTLINGDISPLWEIDMGENALACVEDSVGFKYAEKFNISKYYNAGVILFNMDVIRSGSTFKDMIDFLQKNVANFSCNDQDLINTFFKDSIIRLPLQYNYQGIHYLYSPENYKVVVGDNVYYNCNEIYKAKEQPIIIHFFRIFGQYPWEDGNYHPLKEAFHSVYDEMDWGGEIKKSSKSSRKILSTILYHMYMILGEKLYFKFFMRMRNRSIK